MIILSLALMALTALAAAPSLGVEVGDTLPHLRGELLTGRDVVLPQAASGRVALLLLGFTYNSRFAVEAWAQQFRREFGSESKVTFYEIPMIGGLARLGKWFIDSGMRRGTPKSDYEHVITVYGGVEPWKKRLAFSDPDAAYLILLDQSGKLAWRHAGGFDQAQYVTLAAAVAKLLSGN